MSNVRPVINNVGLNKPCPFCNSELLFIVKNINEKRIEGIPKDHIFFIPLSKIKIGENIFKYFKFELHISFDDVVKILRNDFGSIRFFVCCEKCEYELDLFYNKYSNCLEVEEEQFTLTNKKFTYFIYRNYNNEIYVSYYDKCFRSPDPIDRFSLDKIPKFSITKSNQKEIIKKLHKYLLIQ